MLTKPPPTYDLQGRAATLSVQKYVSGTVAGVALAALNGKTLAAYAYCKENKFPSGQGPASVIRIINRPDLVDLAARAVSYFGFPGLGGFDFILDDRDGSGLLLEFNARPGVTIHLGSLIGTDLCGSLYAALTGTAAPTPSPEPPLSCIALFPNEWRRDNNSPYLHTAYHDVPWDDPQLLLHLVQTVVNKPS